MVLRGKTRLITKCIGCFMWDYFVTCARYNVYALRHCRRLVDVVRWWQYYIDFGCAVYGVFPPDPRPPPLKVIYSHVTINDKLEVKMKSEEVSTT